MLEKLRLILGISKKNPKNIYIIFAIYAVVSIGAIFTLNRKINTLYGSITSMEKSMQEMQDNAGSTVSDNGN